MASKGRKIIAIVFSAATLVSILIIGYSLVYYVEVALALRSTLAYVKDFRIEFIDESHAVVYSNVVVNNTTPFQFTWLWVEENVYVNQTRVGTKYEVFPENNPRLIPPRAETNQTLETHVYLSAKPEVAQWLSDPSKTKIWVAFIDLYCDAPLQGRIKISTSARLETH